METATRFRYGICRFRISTIPVALMTVNTIPTGPTAKTHSGGNHLDFPLPPSTRWCLGSYLVSSFRFQTSVGTQVVTMSSLISRTKVFVFFSVSCFVSLGLKIKVRNQKQMQKRDIFLNKKNITIKMLKHTRKHFLKNKKPKPKIQIWTWNKTKKNIQCPSPSVLRLLFRNHPHVVTMPSFISIKYPEVFRGISSTGSSRCPWCTLC